MKSDATETDGSTIRREQLAELLPSDDGRTLEVRIIPYDTVTRVSDDGGRTFYDEEWAPGAFDKQLDAAHRILANFEHQQGIQGTIARGTELRDSDSALEGTFRMLNHPDADKALELVNEGILSGVSVEAVPLKTVRTNGVVRRVKAHLVNIGLCRAPAYKGAAVLAVREEKPEPEEPEPEPEPEPEMTEIERLESESMACQADEALTRVGYEPLLTRAVTRRPWDGAPARFTDEQYKRSCLIDRGGDAPVKERCSLPVLEPSGDVNANALGAAAAALAGARGGVGSVSSAQKAAAARKLIRYYGQAEMEPPASLRVIAAR